MDIRKVFDVSDFETLELKWGLRGDPFLWEELRKRAESKVNFRSKQDFEIFIDENFKAITQSGNFSEDGSRVYVKNFNHGGMSGGWIAYNTWITKILPLLKNRY
jgi:hypothetical protein